ncbi:hypothetical protein NEAUS04_0259 [Nematocida ausubeli]|uniref:Uncharacterized protein n=1 Tax=Nematocida ausubeli (strain ATCC PRA-371 / ERTm2) TaxID=1913371 RepID=H8ZD94_NEMA1|nr:uncharacterized protein NESG_00326 [Nematocida ausubeli]EHY65119.1 hypothetical protein NERG_01565 [Nematocida ausubeli]KAI5133015.1 hypothetical protein NEAUS07_0370 [Nematocida ausubeli]KAI5136828.1 hypothetical protein NEAUS06_2038 [Nematocida ausubeli]KAI5147094.1 hypothetical protein NEAUS05_0421 [Nematocida ausubeli]KAI5161047.1 hypothetical protein NEAUS04_0259 [Nematocida ausubeli]
MNVSLFSSLVLFDMPLLTNILLYSATILTFTIYYTMYNIYDVYYMVASIFIMCSELSIFEIAQIFYSYFYFYFFVLLCLLFLIFFVLYMCCNYTDNIVITISSIVCSMLFMIIFFSFTSQPLDLLSFLIRGFWFLVLEMAIIAGVIVNQHL